MMKTNLGVLCLVILIIQSLTHQPCRACARPYSYYSNNAFMGNDAGQMFSLPSFSFKTELSDILSRKTPTQHSEVDYSSYDQSVRTDRTLSADFADLESALRAAGHDDQYVKEMMLSYTYFRKEVMLLAPSRLASGYIEVASKEGKPSWEFRPYVGSREAANYEQNINAWRQKIQSDWQREGQLLEALPAEFSLYAQGALFYRLKDYEKAAELWNQVLALPASERKYRSTWAAYMLGRLAMIQDSSTAIAWFERTRKFAAEGFTDSLGLAADSWSWQGWVELEQGYPARALASYYECGIMRGDMTSVYESIKNAAERLLDRPDEIKVALNDARLTDIVIARVITRKSMNWYTPELLAHCLANQELYGSRIFDYFIWTAYEQGRFEEAGLIIASVKNRTTYTTWVESKLLARDGKFDEAITALESIRGKSIQGSSEWSDSDETVELEQAVHQELAILHCAQGRFVQALQALDQFEGYTDPWSGSRDDYYLLEDVLTVDEAVLAVRDRPEGDGWRQAVAKRLFRLGRYREAMPLFDAEAATLTQEFVRLIRADGSPPGYRRQRAIDLIKAAQLINENGSYLLANEISFPRRTENVRKLENANYSGRGEFLGPLGQRPTLREIAYLSERVGRLWQARQSAFHPSVLELVAGTDAELARVIRHRAEAPRFEGRRARDYNKLKANLLWEAAELLPNNDPATAYALWWGGVCATSYSTPEADRFYKALVNRCRRLTIGKEADRKRWFPSREFLPAIEKLN